MEKETEQINSLLSWIHSRSSQDDAFARALDYHVKKKGQRDEARMAKFFTFRGPDDNTATILELHLHGWLRNPHTFWIRPGREVSTSKVPQLEIVRSYIQTERDDA
jgi:hypothetical protein